MTDAIAQRSVAHGSFTIERTYHADPRVVFEAWASEAAKNAWFGEGDDFLSLTAAYSLDFQEGGRERLHGSLPDGRTFTFDGIFHDIVADRRIVSSYEVAIDGRRNSVSLMTVELESTTDGGTKLTLTEQGAFFDSLDSNEQREEGAADSLNQLAAFLGRSGMPPDDNRAG